MMSCGEHNSALAASMCVGCTWTSGMSLRPDNESWVKKVQVSMISASSDGVSWDDLASGSDSSSSRLSSCGWVPLRDRDRSLCIMEKSSQVRSGAGTRFRINTASEGGGSRKPVLFEVGSEEIHLSSRLNTSRSGNGSWD